MKLPHSRAVRSQAVAIRARKLVIGAIAATAISGGCAQQPDRVSASGASHPALSPWAAPTSTMRWNEYACELIARNQVGQFPAARTLAYMNLAINNAIVTARQQGRKPDGAAAGAAAAVLSYVFLKDEQAIAARLSTETNALGADARSDFGAGVQIGRAAASDVIAAAKSDRADLAWAGPPPTSTDKWSSLAQPPRPPLGPRLGEARPFFLTTGADYRAPAPPGYDSPAFRKTVSEVRAISDSRTNEQVRIAQYWENLTGSFSAGLWNDVARGAISSHGLTEVESARVLALVHMASVDATIACHDSKYTYWVPRPTQADPEIRLAIGVPNHPSYPSNHACISGTVGLVLDAQFPDERGRYFAMGRQAGESRIYAGIHYRIDVDEGIVIARKVAARALEVGVPADRPFVPMGK
ncbi:MAG TPA: phosphatase PAP2 family protein [Burkholderiales bacterium]|nr:phosphatase PAP2 family protein [Burkholderiales bacterium]